MLDLYWLCKPDVWTVEQNQAVRQDSLKACSHDAGVRINRIH